MTSSVSFARGGTKVPRLFVTGTDTGVGKTRIATALCLAFVAAGRRVTGMKPVASGCVSTPDGLRNDDALALKAAMNVRADYADVNPYAFEPAIAPHIAAKEAGRCIDFEVLERSYERLCLQSEVTIVEGAGGWLAPLDDVRTFAELAVRWRLDVVLVVGLRLGCLNHALLTVESIHRLGLKLAGWVGNSVEAEFPRRDANVQTLRARIDAPCLGVFPHAPTRSAAEVAMQLRDNLEVLEPTKRP
jgi:dethiobiotin synthetase